MNYLKTAFTIFMTSMVTLFGDLDKTFYFLLIIICLDYFTGVTDAYLHEELNSVKGMQGFLKKCGYIVIVIVANLVDVLMNLNGTLRTLVIYFFIANDGISILEHLGKIGVPLPKKLYTVLEQLKEQETKEKIETEILKEKVMDLPIEKTEVIEPLSTLIQEDVVNQEDLNN